MIRGGDTLKMRYTGATVDGHPPEAADEVRVFTPIV